MKTPEEEDNPKDCLEEVKDPQEEADSLEDHLQDNWLLPQTNQQTPMQSLWGTYL
jgi:hypothetical protein